jgi:hypothetical protein
VVPGLRLANAVERGAVVAEHDRQPEVVAEQRADGAHYRRAAQDLVDKPFLLEEPHRGGVGVPRRVRMGVQELAAALVDRGRHDPREDHVAIAAEVDDGGGAKGRRAVERCALVDDHGGTRAADQLLTDVLLSEPRAGRAAAVTISPTYCPIRNKVDASLNGPLVFF